MRDCTAMPVLPMVVISMISSSMMLGMRNSRRKRNDNAHQYPDCRMFEKENDTISTTETKYLKSV
jgi:hypothetical protein